MRYTRRRSYSFAKRYAPRRFARVGNIQRWNAWPFYNETVIVLPSSSTNQSTAVTLASTGGSTAAITNAMSRMEIAGIRYGSTFATSTPVAATTAYLRICEAIFVESLDTALSLVNLPDLQLTLTPGATANNEARRPQKLFWKKFSMMPAGAQNKEDAYSQKTFQPARIKTRCALDERSGLFAGITVDNPFAATFNFVWIQYGTIWWRYRT